MADLSGSILIDSMLEDATISFTKLSGLKLHSAKGVLWRKLKRDKHILDFSAWETVEGFKGQFDKLIKGMQINY